MGKGPRAGWDNRKRAVDSGPVILSAMVNGATEINMYVAGASASGATNNEAIIIKPEPDCPGDFPTRTLGALNVEECRANCLPVYSSHEMTAGATGFQNPMNRTHDLLYDAMETCELDRRNSFTSINDFMIGDSIPQSYSAETLSNISHSHHQPWDTPIGQPMTFSPYVNPDFGYAMSNTGLPNSGQTVFSVTPRTINSNGVRTNKKGQVILTHAQIMAAVDALLERNRIQPGYYATGQEWPLSFIQDGQVLHGELPAARMSSSSDNIQLGVQNNFPSLAPPEPLPGTSSQCRRMNDRNHADAPENEIRGGARLENPTIDVSDFDISKFVRNLVIQNESQGRLQQYHESTVPTPQNHQSRFPSTTTTMHLDSATRTQWDLPQVDEYTATCLALGVNIPFSSSQYSQCENSMNTTGPLTPSTWSASSQHSELYSSETDYPYPSPASTYYANSPLSDETALLVPPIPQCKTTLQNQPRSSRIPTINPIGKITKQVTPKKHTNGTKTPVEKYQFTESHIRNQEVIDEPQGKAPRIVKTKALPAQEAVQEPQTKRQAPKQLTESEIRRISKCKVNNVTGVPSDLLWDQMTKAERNHCTSTLSQLLLKGYFSEMPGKKYRRPNLKCPAVIKKGETVTHGKCLLCRFLPTVKDSCMIECLKCQELYHIECVGMTSATESHPEDNWFCKRCITRALITGTFSENSFPLKKNGSTSSWSISPTVTNGSQNSNTETSNATKCSARKNTAGKSTGWWATPRATNSNEDATDNQGCFGHEEAMDGIEESNERAIEQELQLPFQYLKVTSVLRGELPAVRMSSSSDNIQLGLQNNFPSLAPQEPLPGPSSQCRGISQQTQAGAPGNEIHDGTRLENPTLSTPGLVITKVYSMHPGRATLDCENTNETSSDCEIINNEASLNRNLIGQTGNQEGLRNPFNDFSSCYW